jgi:hypothetical protein
LRESAPQPRQAAEETNRQIQQLEPVHFGDDAEQCRVVGASGDCEHPGQAEDDGWHICRHDDRAANRPARPTTWPFGKNECEVQEERWKREDRNRVGPVEHPIQSIEPAAEREAQHSEERDRDPEKVQRGRVARPAHPDRATDQ